ncbi:MAG: hypothetical protein V1790_12410, partial [Planctomycetota bacterium]
MTLYAAPALASPGGNRCDLAIPTTITPGPPGDPASYLITGNNSNPGTCSVSGSPCALDVDCPVGETCEPDCLNTQLDRGWWEAFDLTADARVTIHFCETTPVRQGADWVFVATSCEPGTGACPGAVIASGSGRADICSLGYACPDVPCGAGNNNISMTFNTLAGGRTYYLPILSANVCERTDIVNQSGIMCETDADCPVDRPCVSARGPYSIRVLAAELPLAACCHSDASCDERTILSCEGIGGTFLAPPNLSPAIPLCIFDPCATGSCCVGEAGCKDSRETSGHVPMTKAICEAGPFNGSYVGGIFCKGGTCASGPDMGLSCTVPDDCALGAACTGTPMQLAQPSPCHLCTVDPSYCHEPVSGSARFVSDLDRGATTADDFIPDGSPITDVCWWGYYENDSAADCSPGPGDAFTITFYTDAGGYPGSTIVSQAVSPGRLQTVLESNLYLYEYSATLATPVTVTPGVKHWIEIVNDTSLPPTACNWAWKQSNGGNNYSVMNMGDGYAPEDVYHGAGDADAAFCLNTSIAPDDGGAVLGACCTCPPSCVEARTRALCNGVWHVGQTCAALSCSPPTVDNCAAAQPLIASSTPFHNTCANRDGPATIPTDSGSAAVDRDVWYTYYAGATNPNVTFSACDVSFDAVIAVYSNGTGVCSCPTDNTNLIAASDEGCLGPPYVGGGGTVSIPVTVGNCYLVRVAGWDGGREIGLGRIDVSQLGVPAGIIYVNAAATGLNNGTSWQNAFTSLQNALAVPTANGTEIWVAKGTYEPATCSPPCNGSSPERSATFQLKSGVGLYGGFFGGESSRDLRDPANNVTILSGDLNGDDIADLAGFASCYSGSGQAYAPGCASFDLDIDGDVDAADGRIDENAYHVVTASGTNATAVLDGFTITSGNADRSTDPDYNGGGILMVTGGATFRSLTVQTNFATKLELLGADSLGGGVAVEGGGSPTFYDVQFRNNLATKYAGGLHIGAGGADATLVRCRFVGNRSFGTAGGLFVLSSHA